jgi:outer membrane protein
MNNPMRGRIRRWLIPLAAICAASGGGCVDQPKDIALYRKQLDALPGVTSVPVPPEQAPLSLQQALALAEKNDESLGLSGETYVQALIAKDRAFSAFLPQISIDPTYSQSQKIRGEGPAHSFNVSANLSMNFFNGFRDQATIEEDTATSEEDRLLLLNEQQIVLLDVVETYYKVLQDERQVTVFQNSLAEQDESVRQAQAKFDLGSGTLLDIAQSQSQASQTRVSLIQAVASVKTDRAMLTFLIGSPADSCPLTDQYEPPLEIDQSLAEWITEAENNRQDLRADASAVAAARQGLRVTIGEYYPSIALNPLSYLIYKEVTAPSPSWSAIFTVNIPIFTGGQIESDVRNAYSLLRAALLTQSQARKQVEDDVRTDYASLESSRDQIKELRVELKASSDSLIQSQRQFNVGLATNLDVLTAQTQLLSTQLQLATQEYQKKIAFLSLLRVSGRLTLVSAAPTQRAAAAKVNAAEITTPDVIQSTTLPAR